MTDHQEPAPPFSVLKFTLGFITIGIISLSLVYLMEIIHTDIFLRERWQIRIVFGMFIAMFLYVIKFCPRDDDHFV